MFYNIFLQQKKACKNKMDMIYDKFHKNINQVQNQVI